MDDVIEQLKDAHNEVMSALAINTTEIWNAPGVLQGVTDFVQAIDWTEEPNFLYLGAFHGIVWLSVLLFGHQTSNRLMCSMIVLFGFVFSATYLNQFGQKNYRWIFPNTQTNYFDREGMFISAVFSGPLMVLAFLLQIKMIIMLSKMMMVVKRGQLKAQQQQQSKQKGSAGKALEGSQKQKKKQ